MRVCNDLREGFAVWPGMIPGKQKKRTARTCLRPEKAVIDSPSLRLPLFLVLGISCSAFVGKAEKSTLGGLAQWASFF
jgi:hypothetical protein